MIGVTIFIIAILVAVIWITIEIKRLKHKLFAIFLIGLILFAYFSAFIVFRGQEIEYTSLSGMTKAGGLYFAFLTGIFSNVATITSHAIKMDWGKVIPKNQSLEK